MARKNSTLFAKFDLDYADHPKIAALSDGAFRAHVEMILYSRKYLTDGRIPKRFANRFGTESVSELLSNSDDAPSLVESDDGDYWLHDYADHQETKAEVEARRLVNAENGKRGGRPANRPTKRTKTQSVTDSVSDSGSEMKAETETETEVSSTSPIADAIREDVEALCEHLASRIEGNGSKKPTVGKLWRDQARLLLDLDKRTPEEAHRLIDWCQDDAFWMANIQSMAKFRQKFDQLRLQSQRTAGAATPEQKSAAEQAWGPRPEMPAWLFDRGDEDAS